MVSGNKSETTRLTEVQAKALADWWGGSYRQIMNLNKTGEVWHGVILGQQYYGGLAKPLSQKLAVFTLEEARALENFRDAVNPGAPDWVG